MHVDAALDDWGKRIFTEETAEIFWSSAFTVLQKQAQQHTGRFIFSSLSTVLRKLSLFLLAGGLIYALGGWAALVGFFKVLFSNGGHG